MTFTLSNSSSESDGPLDLSSSASSSSLRPSLPPRNPRRTDSTGARTPTSRKPTRNPWTLFMRLPTPANETELRDFFGEAKGGVRVPPPPAVSAPG